MSSISIIGLGGMARAIATRAVEGGNTVEVIGRDAAKANGLAAELGGSATAGAFGATPAGDIVVSAVPYASATQVLAQFGDALADKIVIDISNTFNADATGLVTPDGTSGAQEIAQAMLRRQQASAVVAARSRIVEGAVGMVRLALEQLADQDIVDLDEERKAAMVSNLMVVLCSDQPASPIVNAGSLYS